MPVLSIVSTLVKTASDHIGKEFENGNISKNMLEHLMEEFKIDSISNLQQMNVLKDKCKDVMGQPEVKKILDIIKIYFTDSIVLKIQTDCKKVLDSSQFKNFTSQYTKEKLLTMFQKQELNFVNIRQMIFDSGLMELLGDDFEIPLNFEEFSKMVKKYTDKDLQSKDIKEFFEENVNSLSEIPQLKTLLKNTGLQNILEPVLSMFKKTDYKEETKKRKDKRMKKQLKKLQHQ